MKAQAATRAQDTLGAGVASLTMTIDTGGALLATIGYGSPPDGDAAIQVELDGVVWAVIPAQPIDGAPGARMVTCSMPPAAQRGAYNIALRSASSGDHIGQRRVLATAAVRNPFGLPANDVLRLNIAPMFSVPWLTFDGGELVISGAHLPPDGNPANLKVSLGEGVEGSLEYPLPSPEFGAHYWYWPNAHWSGFRLRLNLPASAPGSDPFTFKFESRSATPAVSAGQQPWPDRARVWLPADLRGFIGYPTDCTQLTRVQTWSEQKTVTLTGYNAFRAMESLLAWHGVHYRPGICVLDWGCGHGRIARHFVREWPLASIVGADIDSENILWCQSSIPNGTFLKAPLWPPTEIVEQTFDAIFGLSVMTHLTADAQRAWLHEIHRILKPGGIALISFGGDGAAAYASIHHTQDWWDNWLERGFDDGLHDPALDGKITDASYYRVTHQNAKQVRRAWQGLLNVIAIEHQAFGYQDVAVLKRPA